MSNKTKKTTRKEVEAKRLLSDLAVVLHSDQNEGEPLSIHYIEDDSGFDVSRYIRLYVPAESIDLSSSNCRSLAASLRVLAERLDEREAASHAED